MIKLNEVRHGNYCMVNGVQIDGIKTDDLIVKISLEGLVKAFAVGMAHKGKEILCFDLKDDSVQPIHLTPDILEKCGFENKVSFYTINNIISFGFSDGKIDTTYIMGDNVIMHVVYLHQLQNLYSTLTGEELKIPDYETA